MLRSYGFALASYILVLLLLPGPYPAFIPVQFLVITMALAKNKPPYINVGDNTIDIY